MIDLRRDFEESRSVALEGWPIGGGAILVHRWAQQGLQVQVSHEVSPALDFEELSGKAPRAGGQKPWTWIAAAPGDADVVRVAAAAGLVMGEAGWTHSALAGISAAKAFAVLTVRAGGNGQPAGLSTLAFSARPPAEWGPIELDAIDALSRDLPVPAPGLRLYEGRNLRLSVPLSLGGRPRLGLARSWDQAAAPSGLRDCPTGEDREGQVPSLLDDMLVSEWRRMQGIAASHGWDLGTPPAALWLAEFPESDRPHQAAGWFSREANRLVLACGVQRAARDAISAWVLGRVCEAAGPEGGLEPGELAFLAEVKSAPPHPVAGGAQAAPMAQLPRAVAVRYGGSVDRSQAAFGTALGAQEMHEMSALGFGAVCLEVHVPIVAPAKRASLPVEFDRWAHGVHRPVTLEGDGAVLLAAEHARRAGLKVILWPRVMTGPGGGLVGQDVVPGPEHWYDLAGRAAQTSALIAGLAQEMDADALVLFDGYFLPTEAEKAMEVAAKDTVAAVRVAMLEGAGAFEGPKVCVSESAFGLTLVQETEEFDVRGLVLGLDSMPALSGPAGNRRHDLRRLSAEFERWQAELGEDLQMIQFSLPGNEGVRRGRDPWGRPTDKEARTNFLSVLIESLKSADGVPLLVVRGWLPGGGSSRGFDVSRWPAALQRSLAALR